jgi:type IV secretory pathway TrbD component
LAIWAIIVGQGLALWVVWAWVLQAPAARRFYAGAARWIDAGFGLALWILAVRVLF